MAWHALHVCMIRPTLSFKNLEHLNGDIRIKIDEPTVCLVGWDMDKVGSSQYLVRGRVMESSLKENIPLRCRPICLSKTMVQVHPCRCCSPLATCFSSSLLLLLAAQGRSEKASYERVAMPFSITAATLCPTQRGRRYREGRASETRREREGRHMGKDTTRKKTRLFVNES
jgi:hypothetical protein